MLVILFQADADKIPKSDIEETKLNTNDTTVAIKIGNPVKNYQREVISFVTSQVDRPNCNSSYRDPVPFPAPSAIGEWVNGCYNSNNTLTLVTIEATCHKDQ